MDEKKGLGLPSILTIIFVIAKLFGAVDWSWWLVFSPLFATIVLFLIILLVVFVVEATID